MKPNTNRLDLGHFKSDYSQGGTMVIKKLPDKCPLCGGTKKTGKTIFVTDLG